MDCEANEDAYLSNKEEHTEMNVLLIILTAATITIKCPLAKIIFASCNCVWKFSEIDIHSFIHFIFNTISTTIRPESLLSSPVILKVLSEDHGILETLNRVYEVKIIFIIKSIHCLSFQFVDFVLIVQKQPLA